MKILPLLGTALLLLASGDAWAQKVNTKKWAGSYYAVDVGEIGLGVSYFPTGAFATIDRQGNVAFTWYEGESTSMVNAKISSKGLVTFSSPSLGTIRLFALRKLIFGIGDYALSSQPSRRWIMWRQPSSPM